MKKKSDDFDVDAAMAAEGISLDGFDVDAAMEAEGLTSRGAGPAPRESARDVAMRQLSEPAEETGPIMGRAPQIPTDSAVGRGLANARSIRPVDVDDVKAPYVGLTQVLSFGLANKIRDADPNSPLPAAERERLAREKPTGTAAGKALGYGVSAVAGPAKALDVAARAASKKVAPWLFGSAAGRVAEATARNAATGAAQGGAIEGDAKGGAIAGAAVGGGAQAVGELGSGFARWLKGDPMIKRFSDAVDDGRMSRVEAGAKAGEVTKDPVGQFSQAAKARDRIMKRDEALAADESAALAAAREPHLKRPADVSAVDEAFNAARAGNKVPSTGAVIDEGFMGALDDMQAKLGRAPTVEDVLALRQSYRERAGFGAASPTDAQVQARQVYGALREGARKASPEVAAADDAYAAAQQTRARRNDILFGNEDGARPAQIEGASRVPDETRAAVKLGRVADDSVEGARAKPQLEELAKQDPEFAAALSDLEAYKAWVATRAGMPQIPTNLSQAVSWPFRLAETNARAIGARAGLPAAAAAEKAGKAMAGKATQIAPFFRDLGEAARGRRKEKRR